MDGHVCVSAMNRSSPSSSSLSIQNLTFNIQNNHHTMKTNRLTTRLLPLLAAFALLGSAHAQTAVPDFLSYQGRALNADGTAIGAGTAVNRTVTFRIWDHPSNALAANLIYSEQQVVTIANGEFSSLIGAGAAITGTPLGYSESTKGVPTVKISTPSVFGAATRYLGVTIDDGTAAVDNEISPRQQFVTSSYAFRAKVAESVDANAISSAMLANSAVGSTQLAAASVTNAKLGTDAVLTTNIGNLNVTTAKLADLNVTTGKIADANVTTAKIADANVTTAKIADLNVTTGKLADASVTGTKIASATIAAANLATGAVTSTGILDGTIATADMADSAVTTAKLADNSVVTADLADNSVTSAKIANATVTGTDIAAGTITADNLGTNTATTVENLRIIRGSVAASGALVHGTGFTSAAEGNYIKVTFPAGTFSSIPTVVVSPLDIQSGWTQYVIWATTTSFHSAAALSGTSGAGRQNFTFIAIGPR
jgi:uncharacterized protein YjbI with pentapeptide repeats